MRLIDASELRKLFKEEFKRTKKMIDDGQTHLDTLAEGYAEADHLLRFRALTVDAVPVVRCRDCASFELKGKYPAGMPEYPEGMPYGYCYHWDYEEGMLPNQVDGDAFCSYGKRKVDENGRT